MKLKLMFRIFLQNLEVLQQLKLEVLFMKFYIKKNRMTEREMEHDKLFFLHFFFVSNFEPYIPLGITL